MNLKLEKLEEMKVNQRTWQHECCNIVRNCHYSHRCCKHFANETWQTYQIHQGEAHQLDQNDTNGGLPKQTTKPVGHLPRKASSSPQLWSKVSPSVVRIGGFDKVQYPNWKLTKKIWCQYRKPYTHNKTTLGHLTTKNYFDRTFVFAKSAKQRKYLGALLSKL